MNYSAMYAKCPISLPESPSLAAVTYIAVYLLHVEYVVMKVTGFERTFKKCVG